MHPIFAWLPLVSSALVAVLIFTSLPKQSRPLSLVVLLGLVVILSLVLLVVDPAVLAAAIASVHPVLVWLPLVSSTVVLVLMFTVVTKPERTLSRIALAGFVWMGSLWLLMGRYPAFLDVAALPFLLILAVVLCGAMVHFCRFQASVHGASRGE